jgi:hypothetical protein
MLIELRCRRRRRSVMTCRAPADCIFFVTATGYQSWRWKYREDARKSFSSGSARKSGWQ